MKVIKFPENGERFVNYAVDGSKIFFGDDEIMADLKKKERDDDVKIDVCKDYLDGLVFGSNGARVYVAQIHIPARRYKDVEVENPDYRPDDEFSQERIMEHQPIPFDMDNVELTLFEEV